jgi:hypothetical protein
MDNNTKKIDPKEQGEVLDLIKTYRYCNDKISECVMEIKGIEKKRDELLGMIEKTRTNEKEWVAAMIAKYGSGRLNLETMEWHPDAPKAEVLTETPETPADETPTEDTAGLKQAN